MHIPLNPTWPLHDIFIAKIVWCMTYTREIEGVFYITQSLCNSIATVWAM